MKKYTANYTSTNPNFVIQNLVDNPIQSDLLSVLSFIKHILQREVPAIPSKYLQSQIGNRQSPEDFDEEVLDQRILTDEEVAYLFPSLVMRFQVLLIELLTNNYLRLNEPWNFNILLPNQKEVEIFEDVSYRDEFYGLVQIVGNIGMEVAINDLLLEIKSIYDPGSSIEKQNFNINYSVKKDEYIPDRNVINIDFSLLKKFDDKNDLMQDIIYIRSI